MAFCLYGLHDLKTKVNVFSLSSASSAYPLKPINVKK